MNDISILVAGTGHWGNEWLRVLSSLDGVSIGATAGHREPELRDRERLAPGYRHYRDYREGIDEADVDAVLVTLPARLHADAILRSVAAGRHVLCEKPLAETAADIATLLAAVADHPDVVLAVSQNYRWRPWAQAVRAAIDDGAVGAIAHIGLRFSQPEFLAGARMEQDNPLLQDMAIHHFDLLRFLAGGNALELYARQHTPSWNRFPGSPGLDMIVSMEGGVQVSYTGTWAGRGGVTTWDGDYAIQGERGLLVVIDGEVALLPDAGTFDTSGKGTIEAPDPMPIAVPDAMLGDLATSFEDFRAAVESGAEPATGIRDNAHSVAILLAAEESLRLGRPVTVESWADAPSDAIHR